MTDEPKKVVSLVSKRAPKGNEEAADAATRLAMEFISDVEAKEITPNVVLIIVRDYSGSSTYVYNTDSDLYDLLAMLKQSELSLTGAMPVMEGE